MDLSENIQFSYDKIFRFLSRRQSGYVFAMADDYRFIRQINNDLLSDLQNKGITAGVLFLNGKSDEPLLYQLKQHIQDNGALIIANLYEIINDEATGRNNLSHLNFSREEIQDLAVPLLFWADKKSISSITNNAPDLFSQRSLTTVYFTGQVAHPVEEVMKKEDWKEFISTDKFKDIEAKIETLKRRLADAEAAGYQPARIAGEIALPLAKEYAELGSNQKAEAVLSGYQPFLKENNADQLTQLAWVFFYLHNYTQAISLLQQANAILENTDVLPDTWFYNNIQITDWLTENSRLDDAMLVLQKSRDEFNKNKTHYPPLTASHILSLITNRFGSVTQALGNLQEAKSYFEQYLVITKELSDSSPYNEELKRNLGISYFNLGDIAQRSGNLPEAKINFQQYLSVTKELSEANPQSEQFKRDLGISYFNLGDIALETNNLAEAKTNFELYLSITKDLSATNPQSEQLKRDLGIAYNKLGDIAEQSGNLPEAIGYYKQYLMITNDLAIANPQSEQLKRDLGVSYNKLGYAAQQLGNLQEAKSYFELYISITKDLAKANPHSEQLQRDLGISFFQLASIAEAEKQFTQAVTGFSNALSIFQSLSAANPLSQELKNDIKSTEQRLTALQQPQPTQN